MTPAEAPEQIVDGDDDESLMPAPDVFVPRHHVPAWLPVYQTLVSPDADPDHHAERCSSPLRRPGIWSGRILRWLIFRRLAPVLILSEPGSIILAGLNMLSVSSREWPSTSFALGTQSGCRLLRLIKISMALKMLLNPRIKI